MVYIDVMCFDGPMITISFDDHDLVEQLAALARAEVERRHDTRAATRERLGREEAS